MSHKRSIVPLLACIGLLTASCGKEPAPAEAPEFPRTTLPGEYSGMFPCEDCPGIDTALWLRADGRFFFAQQYPATATRDAIQAYTLGRWQASTVDQSIELHSEGPVRIFDRVDATSLRMRVNSELEHRLIQKSVMSDFTASVRMTGIATLNGGQYVFTECLSDFVVPIGRRGDFRRFQHQYRSARGRHASIVVELDGRFRWAGNGAAQALIIDRFVRVLEQDAC